MSKTIQVSVDDFPELPATLPSAMPYSGHLLTHWSLVLTMPTHCIWLS